MLILRNIHIASSEFEMCLLDLSPHPAPPQYLPNAVNVVIEECLLHSTFKSLPIPTEILTNILQHLCIIGVAAVTTAPFTLHHIHCHVILLPALLPNIVPKPYLRTEGTAFNLIDPQHCPHQILSRPPPSCIIKLIV